MALGLSAPPAAVLKQRRWTGAAGAALTTLGLHAGLFALLLTRVEATYAGRAYAAYGGIYVAASLGWLWLTEGQVPTRWDLLGGGLCIAGAMVVLAGARA